MAEGQVADAQTQVDASTSADAGSPSTTGQQSTGQQQSQQAASTGTQPDRTGEYERQVRGLTGDLQKERKQRQQFEADLTAARAELEQERRRIQALAGVSPTDPNAEKDEQVKAAFFKMFPWLEQFAKLTPQQIEAMGRTPDLIAAQQAAEQQKWSSHGDGAIDAIGEYVADGLGVDSLSAEQAADVRASFTWWLNQTCQREFAESADGETSKTLDRYERGDESLLEEFAKRYIKQWVEPVRRTVTAREVNRARPVPNSGGRTLQTQVTRPAEFKTLDDRIAYAAQIAKEAGVIRER